jgi:hypothetical protein
MNLAPELSDTTAMTGDGYPVASYREFNISRRFDQLVVTLGVE